MKIIRMAAAMAALLVLTLGTGCKDTKTVDNDNDTPAGNGVYYWKKYGDPSDKEKDFLSDHNIDRLYMRFFEVVYDPGRDVVPANDLWFRHREVPSGVEIVPTIYFTNDALRMLYGRTTDVASKIVSRIKNMAADFGIEDIKEVQIDCDWTTSTQEDFFSLCSDLSDELHSQGIKLSSTIRLHQLRGPVPPVDRGVLMVYNVGELKNIDETNSILNLDVLKKYLDGAPRYELPLDVAYPTFGWGVVYRDNRFLRLMPIESVPDSVAELSHLHDNWYRHVSDPDSYVYVTKNEIVRYERPTADEIMAAKKMVEKYLGYKPKHTILYHLDENQLSHYTNDQIDKIYE